MNEGRIRQRLGVLRHRQFALFWVAGLTSNTGTWAHVIASTIVVFSMTRSTTALGLLGFATYLPLLLFTLPAGVMSDRFDRRVAVVVTHVIGAAAAALLAVTVHMGAVSVEAFAISGFAIYTAYAISKPALSAIFPALVPKDEIGPATAVNSLTYVLGQLFGPLIASVSIALEAPAAAFALNALSYLAVIVVVGRLPPQQRVPSDRGLAALREQLVEGLRFAFRSAGIRAMLVVLAVAAPLPEVMRLMAPAVSVNIGAGGEEFAGVIAAAIGMGSAAGLSVAARLFRSRSIRSTIFAGLIGLSAAALVLASTSSPVVAALASLALGGSFSLAFASVTAAVQAGVPDALRGRVLSIHTLVHLGTRPIFTPAVGWLAAAAGIATATGAFVALLPLGAAAILLSRPAVATLDRQLRSEASDDEGGGIPISR